MAGRMARPVKLLALAVLVIAGCGRDPAALGAHNSKLFESAEAPIKSEWQTAMAAVNTNGYVTAVVTLQKLQQMKLTPQQLDAVNQTVTAVSDQMYQAANKGDARAKQALEELRTLRSR